MREDTGLSIQAPRLSADGQYTLVHLGNRTEVSGLGPWTMKRPRRREVEERTVMGENQPRN